MHISEATRKVLSRYPYMEEYLGIGIINNRALARDIITDVKRELGREVNLQSVISAVRRHPVSKRRREKEAIFQILSTSEVSLRYDVGIITILVDAQTSRIDIRKIDEALVMIQGIDTLTIVVEERHMDAFKDAVINSNRGLASVIVKSPKEITDTPGVLSHLANILATEKINVVEMMSSYTETWFIVNEKDALKAIEAIRGEIKRARK